MLPNWLYGKSKSKLQDILGGGGAPSDYAKVKAQVAQNAEDIALLDTNNQALTNQSNSMANVLGAKNLLETKLEAILYDKVSVTRNSNGIFSVSTNGEVESTQQDILIHMEFIPPVTGQYKLTGAYNVNVILITFNVTDSIWLEPDIGNGVVLSLDQNKKYNFLIVVKPNTTLSTSITVSPMLRPNRIMDGTYAPYAMTNREITDLLTADANLSAPVDLSTYTSYSNLYTAPSDGYVHFVSAASGSTARIIYTYGNNTTAATDPHFTHSTSANNKAFEIFIKKGLKVYIDGLQSGDTINFYPLS